MKSFLKYSVLPGIIMAVIFSVYPRLLSSDTAPKTFDEGMFAFQLVLFFVFIYLGTVTLSSVLSRKETFVASFIFVLLSTLVMDFTSSLFLGISNQSSVGVGSNVSKSFVVTPILNKYNYRLYDQPILIIFLTLIVVGITKAFVQIKKTKLSKK